MTDAYRKLWSEIDGEKFYQSDHFGTLPFEMACDLQLFRAYCRGESMREVLHNQQRPPGDLPRKLLAVFEALLAINEVDANLAHEWRHLARRSDSRELLIGVLSAYMGVAEARLMHMPHQMFEHVCKEWMK